MTITVLQFIFSLIGALSGLAGVFGVGFAVGRSRGKREALRRQGTRDAYSGACG